MRPCRVPVSISPAVVRVGGSRASLDGYHLFHAIRGDLLARLGRAADARPAFQAAARLTQNQRERDYLLARRDALISSG
jgi:RNA polymerase sigma-70 factor, ECF subfamily